MTSAQYGFNGGRMVSDECQGLGYEINVEVMAHSETTKVRMLTGLCKRLR